MQRIFFLEAFSVEFSHKVDALIIEYFVFVDDILYEDLTTKVQRKLCIFN